MSATKRSRQQPAEVVAARSRQQPATKRIKSSHVPVRSGLDFLVDEDARAGKHLEAKLTNGTPRSRSSRVDDSHTLVAHNSAVTIGDEEDDHEADRAAPDVITLSSDEEVSSEIDQDDDAESYVDQQSQSQGDMQSARQTSANGHVSDNDLATEAAMAVGNTGKIDREDADHASEDGDEPAFGDLLRVRHSEPIDLQKSLQSADPRSQGMLSARGQQNMPAGHSLGTMLSQALKTNDKDMLETCLAMNDQNRIRATVQRQTSQEIAILLERIAERVHRRPGRAGILMIWVQWSLVCHGGYIAYQPELMKKLRSLAQVLRQRADGLQPLLHLKGKLDLLAAQLELRRSMQEASQSAHLENQDDEEGVLYIEGQDDDWSEHDEIAIEEAVPKTRIRNRRAGKVPIVSDNDDAEDEDVHATIPNGIPHTGEDESSVEEDEDDDEELNGLLAAGAERSSGGEDDDGDEESSNEEPESEASSSSDDDDDDSSAEEESEMENVKPAKPSTLNRKR